MPNIKKISQVKDFAIVTLAPGSSFESEGETFSAESGPALVSRSGKTSYICFVQDQDSNAPFNECSWHAIPGKVKVDLILDAKASGDYDDMKTPGSVLSKYLQVAGMGSYEEAVPFGTPEVEAGDIYQDALNPYNRQEEEEEDPQQEYQEEFYDDSEVGVQSVSDKAPKKKGMFNERFWAPLPPRPEGPTTSDKAFWGSVSKVGAATDSVTGATKAALTRARISAGQSLEGVKDSGSWLLDKRSKMLEKRNQKMLEESTHRYGKGVRRGKKVGQMLGNIILGELGETGFGQRLNIDAKRALPLAMFNPGQYVMFIADDERLGVQAGDRGEVRTGTRGREKVVFFPDTGETVDDIPRYTLFNKVGLLPTPQTAGFNIDLGKFGESSYFGIRGSELYAKTPTERRTSERIVLTESRYKAMQDLMPGITRDEARAELRRINLERGMTPGGTQVKYPDIENLRRRTAQRLSNIPSDEYGAAALPAAYNLISVTLEREDGERLVRRMKEIAEQILAKKVAREGRGMVELIRNLQRVISQAVNAPNPDSNPAGANRYLQVTLKAGGPNSDKFLEWLLGLGQSVEEQLQGEEIKPLQNLSNSQKHEVIGSWASMAELIRQQLLKSGYDLENMPTDDEIKSVYNQEDENAVSVGMNVDVAEDIKEAIDKTGLIERAFRESAEDLDIDGKEYDEGGIQKPKEESQNPNIKDINETLDDILRKLDLENINQD